MSDSKALYSINLPADTRFVCAGGNQREKAREKALKKGGGKKASDTPANAGKSLTERKQRFIHH